MRLLHHRFFIFLPCRSSLTGHSVEVPCPLISQEWNECPCGIVRTLRKAAYVDVDPCRVVGIRVRLVGMTILLWELAPVNGTSAGGTTKLSSRPERSGVEGPAVSFPQVRSVVADKGKIAAPRKLIWTVPLIQSSLRDWFVSLILSPGPPRAVRTWGIRLALDPNVVQHGRCGCLEVYVSLRLSCWVVFALLFTAGARRKRRGWCWTAVAAPSFSSPTRLTSSALR